MKLKIDIDCTPEEARAFLGLPRVAPMQERMMEELEEKMRAHIQDLDPETFMQTWLPATVKGWSDLQSSIMKQMGMGGMGFGQDEEDRS